MLASQSLWADARVAVAHFAPFAEDIEDTAVDIAVNGTIALEGVKYKEFTDYLQNEFSSGAYTHHQKSIIADAPNPYGPLRRLVAFVGGLDLTGGRYDTPNHELFKTLLNEHYGDFR